MRLGTYTTFDCPIKHEDRALAWLRGEFQDIGGKVRRVINPHDFGGYPSFEIDYPTEYEDLIEDEPENETLVEKRDVWHEVANEIQEEYNTKFENWL